MQHRHRDDEAQQEPVGDVDMRLLALQERADEDREERDPDDGQPQVGVPFGLGVFHALRRAEQVARGRHDNEELVAPETRTT